MSRRCKVAAIVASLAMGASHGLSADKEIVIGCVGPLSGPGGSFGLETRQGGQMAVDEWNQKGGLLGKTVKLIAGDDAGNPIDAATVFTKLIQQDRVVGIVGPVTSAVALAGAPICQENRVPMIATVATNIKITKIGDYIFRACFIDPFQGAVAARFTREKLHARKAACLFDLSTDATKGLAEAFRDKFTEMGGQIAAFEGYPPGTTDFRVQLTKILHSHPDLLFIPDYAQDAGLIVKQSRELGFLGSLLGGDGWDSPDLVELAGKDAENSYFTTHFSKADTRPNVKTFINVFRIKYGKEPGIAAVLAYDATIILLDAIKRANSIEGFKVREALEKTHINVVSGSISFDGNRNPMKSAVILKLKNGQALYETTMNP